MRQSQAVTVGRSGKENGGDGDGDGDGDEATRVGRVVKLAVRSRLLVLSLFLLWRVLASPYDTSATLNPPCLGDTPGDSELLIFWYIASLIAEFSMIFSVVKKSRD